MSHYQMQSNMTTDDLNELDEIIAKAISIVPSDCQRVRAKKTQKRIDLKERLILFYDRIRNIREAT